MRQWPIILFHTGDYDSKEARDEFHATIKDNQWSSDVYQQLRNRIEFHKLNFVLPPGVPEDKSVYKPQVSEEKWPGYQHMCRFYAQQIFFHPRISNLTYYMRLDTDSFITKPLCFDPIHRIHQHKKVYSFNRITPDEGYVVRGMWNLIDRYARDHPEVEARLAKNKWPWPEGREDWIQKGITYDGIGVPAYSNNFEIVKVEAFQRPDIVAWTDEIMKDPDRIYSLRWGDAPIRGATISMFFDLERDVEKMCAMQYWHQGEVAQSCRCNAYP
ncbi:nucleotide-diphospho-sugar transferase [Clavulina sp. PMI_390]|nr:nucleotide-diphospho-sugar transferase [Clavulina sp. PMI_390]